MTLVREIQNDLATPAVDVASVLTKRKIIMLRWFFALVGACAICAGQPGNIPRFEAVSIKPVSSDVPMNSTGGPGTDDPGRLTVTRVSVRLMLEESDQVG